MTRVFDIFLSVLGGILLSPLFLVISLWITLDSSGPVFFRQRRVGRHGVDFYMFKFRTMANNAERNGFLTVGHADNRITRSGNFLRKYKLDELPQLLNVLKGDMSIVGPRPEVRKYVDLYDLEEKAVLNVLPGITDFASIAFKNESELLAMQPDPEEFYIRHIMPEKLKLNKVFISNPTPVNYFKVIFLTLRNIFAEQPVANQQAYPVLKTHK